MTWDWAPGAALAAIGSLLSWRVASAKTEGSTGTEVRQLERDGSGLRQDIRDLRQELRDGASELRSLSAMLLKLQASQDVVNVMNAKALEAISRKQDGIADIVSDHSATLRILTELLKKKGLLD